MWLNDKEEEEVNFDWSDRNTNMTAKKDNYSVRLDFFLKSLPFRFCVKCFDKFIQCIHDFLPKIVINFSIWICQGLMRELELREKKVNDIQAMGDKLVRDGHPGKKTIEVINQVNVTEQ